MPTSLCSTVCATSTCFRTDDNQIEIIGRDFRHAYPKKSKADTAVDIVNELERVIGGYGILP